MSQYWFPKYFFKYLTLIIAVLIIILDLFNITDESVLLEAIVAIIAVLVFILIKLDDKVDKLAQIGSFEGITAFRLNRENIPSLENTLAFASEEIIIWGSALYSVHDRSDLILRKLNQGCKVKILMMSLFDENGKINPNISIYQQLTRHVEYKNRVSVAKKEFEAIYQRLNNYQKELFELRYYLVFPTANYIIIDRDSRQAFIRVEPIIYGCLSYEQPSFEIDLKSGARLFKVVCRAFDEVWDKSIKYQQDQP